MLRQPSIHTVWMPVLFCLSVGPSVCLLVNLSAITLESFLCGVGHLRRGLILDSTAGWHVGLHPGREHVAPLNWGLPAPLPLYINENDCCLLKLHQMAIIVMIRNCQCFHIIKPFLSTVFCFSFCNGSLCDVAVCTDHVSKIYRPIWKFCWCFVCLHSFLSCSTLSFDHDLLYLAGKFSFSFMQKEECGHLKLISTNI